MFLIFFVLVIPSPIHPTHSSVFFAFTGFSRRLSLVLLLFFPRVEAKWFNTGIDSVCCIELLSAVFALPVALRVEPNKRTSLVTEHLPFTV